MEASVLQNSQFKRERIQKERFTPVSKEYRDVVDNEAFVRLWQTNPKIFQLLFYQ
jgi:hypothetical protein